MPWRVFFTLAIVFALAVKAGVSRKARIESTVRPPRAVLQLDVPGKVEVVAGGEGAVPIKIVREGFKGDVTLTVEGLPEAVKTPALIIPAGADTATVRLEAGARAGAGSHSLKVLARGGRGAAEAPLLLFIKEAPPMKAVEKPVPTAGKGGLRVEMPEVLELQPGAVGKLLPVQIARDGVTGPVTLTFAGTPAGVTLPAATLDPDRQRLYLLTTATAYAAVGEDEVRLIATCGAVRQEFVLKVKVAR